MATFSNSKLSTFEQCKIKYKFKYIDKIKPEIEGSIESHLGSCVHKTLEWLYLRVKDKRTPNLDDVIIFYSNNWKANFNPKIPIVKKGLTHVDYFNKGIHFLIDYYEKYKPFDDNTLYVEKKFVIDIKELEGYKIMGFIDRIVYNGEKNEIEVHDYKTANSLPTKEKIDNDRQLGLYAIAIKETFGKDKEVKLIWHYLSFNKKNHVNKNRRTIERTQGKNIKINKRNTGDKRFSAE